MKKILALLMSVSMMASLFVSTAVTSYAADEATVKVTSVGKVTVKEGPPTARKDVDYLAFNVSIDSDKALNFEAADGWYNGTGLAGVTLKFAFNSKYFDLSSAKIDTLALPSPQTNAKDGEYVSVAFTAAASALYVGSVDPLYTIRIKPNADNQDLFDKSASDIANLACITKVFEDNKVTFQGYSDWTEGTAGVTDMKCALSYVYPDKDAAPADVKVTGITATPAELKALTVGDKGTIAVEVAPADATEKGVTFASDAEDVISVDADGNYEAKSAGTAKITITAKDGSGVTATVEVSVSAPVIPEPEKVQFVKAVKSDKAATGYWVFKVNKGITETLKVTYANADEKLELDAPAAIGGESDVTFALYLTVTGDRIGKAYTAAVAHGADSATGTAITLD